MKQLVLSSRNSKKITELSTLLSPLGLEVISVENFPEVGEVEETGQSFEDNAALKSEAVSKSLGLPAVADDSGLVVDALDGAPGIYSSRFAGESATDSDNNRLLLEKMIDIPQDKRTARFVCVIAFSVPERETVFFRGETSGKIAFSPFGEGGFGYDPLFISDDLGICFAQADMAEKNRVSHRGRALGQFVSYLKDNPLD